MPVLYDLVTQDWLDPPVRARGLRVLRQAEEAMRRLGQLRAGSDVRTRERISEVRRDLGAPPYGFKVGEDGAWSPAPSSSA